MAPIDPRSPCIIGVARRTWHPLDVGDEGAPEPLAMWEQVVHDCCADTGSAGKGTGAGSGAGAVLSAVNSLKIVYCQSWQYDDPVARLADRLGIDPKQRTASGIGGSVPQVLVSETAEDIFRGDLDCGVVVGAEALATLRRLKKAELRPQWSFRPEERRPFPFDIPFHPAEIAHSVFDAYLTFALFDNARRAYKGLSLASHRDELGRLLAPMTRIAAADPSHSWFPTPRTPFEVAEPTSDNRMVAYPFTKLMMAIMDIDMAAGIVISSHEKADELGVAADKRVYLRGWGYAHDPAYVAEHRALYSSPAMKVAAHAALDGSGRSPADVEHLDLYSCFPSSVSFALDALGLDERDFRDTGDGTAPSKSVTVTGGLAYHGGPGSNYMTHSIAAMVETLRDDPGSFGLVSGVGMHMTKHVYAAWSTTPGSFSPCDREDLAARVARESHQAGGDVAITNSAEGPARVATYSVLHGRDGEPESAVLVCDLADGSRCYARMVDSEALARAEESEFIGSTVNLVANAKEVNMATPA